MLKVTHPLGMVTRYEYEGQGASLAHNPSLRLIRTADFDGHRRVQTEYTHHLSGQVLSTTQTAWELDAQGERIQTSQVHRRSQTSYDSQNNPTDHSYADGQNQHIERDAIGRMLSLKDSQGHAINYHLDSESRLLAWLSQSANGQILNGQLFLRDEQARLRATVQPGPADELAAQTQAGSTQATRVRQFQAKKSVHLQWNQSFSGVI